MSILSGNVIDSRTLNERIEDLESDRQALVDDYDDYGLYDEDGNPVTLDIQTDPGYLEEHDRRKQAIEDWDDENGEELKLLQELKEQGESFPDWEYGTALINEYYFREYAEEEARDIYPIENCWPYTCIDWEQVAEELAMDYSTIEAGGYTFYIRS